MSKITTTQIKNKNPLEPQTSEESIQRVIGFATHWMDRNSKTLILSFFGFLFLCAIYFFWSMISKELALKNFSKSYAIEIELNDFIESLSPSKELKDTSDSKNKKSLNSPSVKETQNSTPKDLVSQKEEKEAQMTEKVMRFVSSQPSHEASRDLALKWSDYLHKEKKYDQAYKVLSKIKVRKSSSLFGLVVLSQGSYLFEMGEYKKSINLYKSIIKNKHWKFLHNEARYRISLTFLKNKDIDQALENLKILASDEGNQGSALIQESKSLIRWIQYQKALEKKSKKDKS